jgi:hypothetical protein
MYDVLFQKSATRHPIYLRQSKVGIINLDRSGTTLAFDWLMAARTGHGVGTQNKKQSTSTNYLNFRSVNTGENRPQKSKGPSSRGLQIQRQGWFSTARRTKENACFASSSLSIQLETIIVQHHWKLVSYCHTSCVSWHSDSFGGQSTFSR